MSDTQLAKGQISNSTLTGPEIIRKTTEKVIQIRERLRRLEIDKRATQINDANLWNSGLVTGYN